MKVVNRFNLNLASRSGNSKAHTVILHHTAGPTIKGAENTLKNQRGLSYHYMIDKDGTVYEYVDPTRIAFHSMSKNNNTIGIAFTGGGKYGPASDLQVEACIELLKQIKNDQPSVKYVTGHKHIDPRGKFNGKRLDPWKIDPRFEGEPENGIDLAADRKAMEFIERKSGLEFRDIFYYRK